jgi:hypothetical protein
MRAQGAAWVLVPHHETKPQRGGPNVASTQVRPVGQRREGFSRVKGNEYKHDAQASESQRVKRHTRLRNVLVFPVPNSFTALPSGAFRFTIDDSWG